MVVGEKLYDLGSLLYVWFNDSIFALINTVSMGKKPTKMPLKSTPRLHWVGIKILKIAIKYKYMTWDINF